MFKRILPACAIGVLVFAAGCGGDKEADKEADKNEDKTGDTAAVTDGDNGGDAGAAVVPASLEGAMVFNVNGMTCEGCVAGVTAKLNELESVEKCLVVLDDAAKREGHAQIIADETATDEIIAAITDLGYTIERTDAGEAGESDSDNS